MKILNYYIKIALIFIFSLCIEIYASDELIQESADQDFDEEIWIDSDEEKELKVLPTQPIETEKGNEEKVGLTLNIPIIGKVNCYSELDPITGQDILRANLSNKNINLSPIPIYFDNFELIIPSDQNPSIHANALLFGKKASVELIEVKKVSVFKETPIKIKDGKKVEALNTDISVLKLRLLFEEKPTLSLFPEKSLELNHIDLLLEAGKKFAILSTEVTIFGQLIVIQFGFTDDSATIDFSLPNATFINIIPFVKDTPLANINLKSVIISAKYLFAKKVANNSLTDQKASSAIIVKKDIEEELKKVAELTAIGSSGHLAFALSAQVDFSSIIDNDLKKYLNLEDLTVNATYSLVDGFHMESTLKNFTVPIIGNISAAKFIVDWTENKTNSNVLTDESPNKTVSLKSNTGIKNSLEKKSKGSQLKISLTGKGVLNIPVPGSENLAYSLNAEYQNKAFVLSGKINESFSYASIKMAAEAEFTANLAKKSIAIRGNTNINDLDLVATLIVAPDEKTKERVISVTATAKASNWQPLMQIESLGFLPQELRTLTLKNLDASFVTEKKSGNKLTANLIIKGQASIMNIDVDAQVNFIKNNNQTGILIKANIPDDALLSTFKIPNIKDAFFALSTLAYEDPVTKAQYAKGLNLAGEFDFTGDLKPLGNLLHIQHLNIVGVVDPLNIRNSKFSIKLPGVLNTGLNIVSFGPLSLEVSAAPSIKLVAEVIVRPDKNQSLVFKGSGGITGVSTAIELNMLGLWSNPFNLISKDFSIGNGTLGFSFITVPPYLNGLKIGGETELSKTQDIKFALSLDLTDATNIALLGQLEGKLTIEEFVSFIVCKVINQKVNLDDIPDLFLENVKISFAPTQAQIGALAVEEGITLKGMISLFGVEAAIDFAIKRTGAKAQADLSPIKLGPLKITSGITAKGDKRITKLGGPSIDIELSTSRQQFLVTGMLDLDYIFSISTDIAISRSGIDFNFKTHVGPDKLKLFMANVKGHSSGPLSNPDFNLHMEMEQNFVNFIKVHIIAGLNGAQKEVQNKINAAIHNINAINKQISTAKSSIDKAKKNVEAWKKKINALDARINDKNKKIVYYKSKLTGGSVWGDIGDTFKGAGHAISTIAKKFAGVTSTAGKKVIKNAKKLVQQGIDAAENQADKVVWAAKIIELGAEIAALESAKNSALLVLNNFQKILDKVVKQIAVGTLEASKRTAQGFLNGVKKGTVQVLKAGKWTVRSLAEGFNIEKIVFDGSLKKIENGKLPGMLFVITILGSKKNLEFNFDFKDVSASASKLAKYITKKFVPGI